MFDFLLLMGIALHWQSDESIYERECGNMPGFAVYYRYPNSQRVTYGQFIKVTVFLFLFFGFNEPLICC